MCLDGKFVHWNTHVFVLTITITCSKKTTSFITYSINKHIFIGSEPLSAQSLFCDIHWLARDYLRHTRASQCISRFDDFTYCYFDVYMLMPDVDLIAKISIETIDYYYNKTSVDYWVIEYNVDIHHWLSILTSATASVSIGILWWIFDDNCIISNVLHNLSK